VNNHKLLIWKLIAHFTFSYFLFSPFVHYWLWKKRNDWKKPNRYLLQMRTRRAVGIEHPNTMGVEWGLILKLIYCFT
jgi:hypothetical protein